MKFFVLPDNQGFMYEADNEREAAFLMCMARYVEFCNAAAEGEPSIVDLLDDEAA